MRSYQSKWELDTPCLVVDVDVLTGNVRKMQSFVEASGKGLRPHAKSHKCSKIAQLQVDNGAIGICAAKLSEAEALAGAGIKDILITGPVITEPKLHRLVELSRNVESLLIAVDDEESLLKLNQIAAGSNVRIEVLIDIDIGLQRTGISVDNVLNFWNLTNALDNIEFRGVQAYAGQVQHIRGFEERRAESLRCLEKVFPLLSRIDSELGGKSIFTAGGTGTYFIDVQVPQVTEIQPGSYVFMDTDYLVIEAPPVPEENRFGTALTLLCTVVSANRDNRVIVDAGLKSLYQYGTNPFPVDNSLTGLKYEWAGDEYGWISGSGVGQLPEVGSILELAVSNCDPTVNLFDYLYVVKDDLVIDTWKIDMRGLSQ